MVNTFNVIAAAVVSYLTIGTIVVLVHPLLVRNALEPMTSKLGLARLLSAIIFNVAGFLLFCTLWPMAWFNIARSERRRQKALDAQLERLAPLARVFTAMNAPVKYGGGDGSSFDDAVVLLGATIVSGPRAEYDLIERHYPGYQFRSQSLKEFKGRTFDVIEFTTESGEERLMHFDISAHMRSGTEV
jgi:hypothetical protein